MINDKVNDTLVIKFTNEINNCNNIIDLMAIDKQMDTRAAQGFLNWSSRDQLDKVWFARKIELT
jgi:hypothetical protein